MKPLIEKLPLTDDTSFVARIHRTPNFEVPWHQHVENEILLITEGAGLSFAGNYVGEFQAGDIFFLGANLPHTFQKSGNLVTSAVVIHFTEDFWGKEFLNLPESKEIKELLNTALQGLKITGKSRDLLQPLIKSVEKEKGFKRIIALCQCLEVLAKNEFIRLSTQEIKQVNNKNRERIDRIFNYTMENFKEPVQLSVIARLADMSVPAFCNYFKKSTRKKYIDFLNEVRIGFACKLLTDNSRTTVEGACYDSGFNTLANFNKQFLKVKGMTPSRYRKVFLGRNNSE